LSMAVVRRNTAMAGGLLKEEEEGGERGHAALQPPVAKGAKDDLPYWTGLKKFKRKREGRKKGRAREEGGKEKER